MCEMLTLKIVLYFLFAMKYDNALKHNVARTRWVLVLKHKLIMHWFDRRQKKVP